MSRATKIISISLPPKFAREVDRFCKKTEFTKSEFLRNALRDYIDSWKETQEVQRLFPSIKRDIREAKKNFRRGDYISLEDLMRKKEYVQSDSRPSRRERS